MDDRGFGQFLVRVSCPCGASRHIEPEALAARDRGGQRDAREPLDEATPESQKNVASACVSGGPCRDRTYDQEIKRRATYSFLLIGALHRAPGHIVTH
jgi:hypothetical protein